MNHRYGFRVLLALLILAALLLTACGTGETPQEPETTEEPSETPAAQLPEGAVEVGTVDELLAAIAPNTTIVLREGEYILSTASDYGTEYLTGYYRWELIYGGSQLVISQLPGLKLQGQGQVSILAQPRYAEVVSFNECWDLQLENITFGHTTAPGACSGGVLNLVDCDNVTLDNCRLFGCGTMGISAWNSQYVTLRNSQIDSCSYGAVSATGCCDLRLEDCTLKDCGLTQDGAGNNLLFADHCKGFALVNCEITGNRMQRRLQNWWSDQVALLGCRVEQNRFLSPMFQFEGRSVTIDKCSFQRRSSEDYYERDGLFAKTPEGEDLISFDLDHMELARAEYDGPAAPEEVHLEWTEREDGTRETHVSTVDELLAAISPNSVIILDSGSYDLTAAGDYGRSESAWYTWVDCYDGYCLHILNVSGMQILGAGKDETLITTTPRYAAIFSFENCYGLTLSGFTAGHSEAPGACTGNVLDFNYCSDINVEDCGLFGCGVLGIEANWCSSFAVRDSEIYDCSFGAATFYGCEGVSFEGCSVHDCDYNANYIFVYSSTVTWNDSALAEGTHEFDGEDYLGMAVMG